MDWKIQYYELIKSSQINLYIQYNSKIPARFFRIYKLILKFMQKVKGLRIDNRILKKNTKREETYFLISKLKYSVRFQDYS